MYNRYNGDCIGKDNGGPEDYEECQYYNYKKEYKPINKSCNEMDKEKCDKCQITTRDYSCLKVDGTYNEIKIDDLCVIDDGNCVKKSDEANSHICVLKNKKFRTTINY